MKINFEDKNSRVHKALLDIRGRVKVIMYVLIDFKSYRTMSLFLKMMGGGVTRKLTSKVQISDMKNLSNESTLKYKCIVGCSFTDFSSPVGLFHFICMDKLKIYII